MAEAVQVTAVEAVRITAAAVAAEVVTAVAEAAATAAAAVATNSDESKLPWITGRSLVIHQPHPAESDL